jgi:hypothetical protein
MPNAFRSKKWNVVWRQLLHRPHTYFRFQYLAHLLPVFQQPQGGLAFFHFTVHKLHQTYVRCTSQLIFIIRLEMELISLVRIYIIWSAVLVFGVQLHCVLPLFHLGMPYSHHFQCEWRRRKVWPTVYSKGGDMEPVVSRGLHICSRTPTLMPVYGS